MTYSERSLILGLVVVGIYCAFLPGLLVCQTTQSENLESHKAVFETKKGLDLDQWHSDVTFDRAIGSSGRIYPSGGRYCLLIMMQREGMVCHEFTEMTSSRVLKRGVQKEGRLFEALPLW